MARGIRHLCVAYGGAFTDAEQDALLDSVEPIWTRTSHAPSIADLYGFVLVHPLPWSLDTPRADVPALPMRPTAPERAAGAALPAWVNELGASRHAVYVTFGTENVPMTAWLAVFEAVGEIDVDVVATTGGQLDIGEFGVLPANVRIEPFVPQGALLERVRLVISHAGAGTLIGAAAAGKPQLCMPLGADQWENADSLTRAGAGITLELDERDPATSQRSIRRLLDDPEITAAVTALSADFAAMPHPSDIALSIATAP